MKQTENSTVGIWKDWRLHALVFITVIVTEAIGTFSIPVGPGVILLLPMLYALII